MSTNTTATNVHVFPQQQTVGAFRVPYGYELWSDGTYRIVDFENVRKLGDLPDISRPKPSNRTPAMVEKICDEPLWMTNIARTFDPIGSESETLAEVVAPSFHDNTEVNRRWLTRLEMSHRSKVEMLASKDFSIGTANALRVAAYFNACLQTNKSVMPTVLMGKSTGMYDLSDNYEDVRGFLIGEQWITDSRYQGDETKQVVHDPRHKNMAVTALHPNGHESSWLHKFTEVNKVSAYARWLNYTTFAPAILKFVEGRTFIVHHWSRTGGGKTALLKFALSAWGDPNQLKATMNRTDKAFIEGFRACTDILSGFDELQSAESNAQLSRIIYAITNERSRGRARAQGGLEEEYTWRTITRTTGEEPLIGADGMVNLGGQTNRVIELKHNVLDSQYAQRLHAWMEKDKNWGHAGPAFCRAVLNMYRENPMSVMDIQRDFLGKLDDFMDIGERRIHLATVAAAQAIFDQHVLRKPEAEALKEAEDTMRVIAEHLRYNDDVVETTGLRGFRALVDHMNAFQAEWVWEGTEKFNDVIDGRHRGRLTGVVLPSQGEVWLVKSSMENVLKRAQVRPDVALKEWRDDLSIIKINKGDRGFQLNRRRGLLKGKFVVMTWDEAASCPRRLNDNSLLTAVRD